MDVSSESNMYDCCITNVPYLTEYVDILHFMALIYIHTFVLSIIRYANRNP